MIVEYVLLLIVAVAIAILIQKTLVKKGEDSEGSGAIINKWNQIQQAISEDDPNKRK